ncbi:putative hydro-lyase [Mesorhizobium argentiipisi]|uniref:Putative hydro-lyase O7A05_10075 n=1 Tax=Mesorhizobium argentiipisi TaxID=3015175 RepID=A0ABU8KBA9_9HYPH
MVSSPGPRSQLNPAVAARLSMRSGEYKGPTGLLARGYVQANVVIVPKEYAGDFLRFCHLNPKPCPLLAVGAPGDPTLPSLGDDIDIRSDLPAYRVLENGREVGIVHDISDRWSDDLVTIAIGCSFSFEEALENAGLGVRHNELGLVNPMYTTNIVAKPAGPFRGNYVVSMRPFTPANTIRAIQVTSRFPGVHGAPLHFGDPTQIGIKDLDVVEFGGNRVPIHDGEVPVFWACGVTSQLAVEGAKLPFCITHKPAHMLIADVRNAEIAVL